MTAKEGPSSFTLVSANISWRFVRLDLKSSSGNVQSWLLLVTLRTLKNTYVNGGKFF
jgi:hypothetical protein